MDVVLPPRHPSTSAPRTTPASLWRRAATAARAKEVASGTRARDSVARAAPGTAPDRSARQLRRVQGLFKLDVTAPAPAPASPRPLPVAPLDACARARCELPACCHRGWCRTIAKAACARSEAKIGGDHRDGGQVTTGWASLRARSAVGANCVARLHQQRARCGSDPHCPSVHAAALAVVQQTRQCLSIRRSDRRRRGEAAGACDRAAVRAAATAWSRLGVPPVAAPAPGILVCTRQRSAAR